MLHSRLVFARDTAMRPQRLGFTQSVVVAGLILASLAVGYSARADPKPTNPPNRLAKETSPYLLLHAHNPVDWYPWGPEAFAKAKKENKPIFISIGYSSC